MVVYFDIKYFFYRFFYLLNSRVTKLFNLSCISIDKMIVLMIKIGFFILSLIFAKLVFSNQTAL